MASLPKLLSYEDLMEIFSCKRASIERMWKKKKTIPPPILYEGLGWRWEEEDIRSYMAEQKVKNANKLR